MAKTLTAKTAKNKLRRIEKYIAKRGITGQDVAVARVKYKIAADAR